MSDKSFMLVVWYDYDGNVLDHATLSDFTRGHCQVPAGAVDMYFELSDTPTAKLTA